MNFIAKLTICSGALLALAACDTPDSGSGSLSPTAQAERACLQRVIAETGNSNAGVGSSLSVDGGIEVIVVVGEQQGAWQCIAYPDGSTSRPMSLTNEGTL